MEYLHCALFSKSVSGIKLCEESKDFLDIQKKYIYVQIFIIGNSSEDNRMSSKIIAHLSSQLGNIEG